MKKLRVALGVLVFCVIQVFCLQFAFASEALPGIDLSIGLTDEPTEVVSSLQVLFLFSIITLTPSLIISVTSFTRCIICLHFLRSALGTQQMPPNQVLIALALFMTLFLMGEPLTRINENAIKPYADGQISQQEAIERGMEPIREFMISQVEDKDVALFASMSNQTFAEGEMPNQILIPAFMLGELTKGFYYGFFIYVPFIVIDMVVASILMSMGMMMLPPAMISLPFKILLFVMIDGWSLVVESILKTFMR